MASWSGWREGWSSTKVRQVLGYILISPPLLLFSDVTVGLGGICPTPPLLWVDSWVKSDGDKQLQRFSQFFNCWRLLKKQQTRSTSSHYVALQCHHSKDMNEALAAVACHYPGLVCHSAVLQYCSTAVEDFNHISHSCVTVQRAH